jgi:glutamyl-tRNA synthetase
MEELIAKFSLDRIHKAGAKFDYEKAKWYNGEWIKASSAMHLLPYVKPFLNQKGINTTNDDQLLKVIEMVKERCVLLTDFYEQASFFFVAPDKWDTNSVKPKWSEDKEAFFYAFAEKIVGKENSSSEELEKTFKDLATEKGIKVGELMLPLRVMLVGGKFGPQVFDIAQQLGVQETISRINNALAAFR